MFQKIKINQLSTGQAFGEMALIHENDGASATI